MGVFRFNLCAVSSLGVSMYSKTTQLRIEPISMYETVCPFSAFSLSQRRAA